MTTTPSGGPTGRSLPQGGKVEVRSSGEPPVQENPYLIVKPSRDIVFTALETFPLSPRQWEAKFFIGQGFYGGGGNNPEEVARLGGIPDVTLEITDRDGSMIPRRIDVAYHRDVDPQRMKLIAGLVMKGGIFQGLNFVGGNGGYEDFRDNWLGGIRERDYDVFEMELWATSHRTGSHYTEGWAMGAGVKIAGYRRSLELIPNDYRSGLPTEDEQRLKEWFAGLRTQAQAPQQSPV